MFTLHAHSNYSLLEGTIRVNELINFAKKSGSSYAALTDKNGMYGLIQFAKIAKEKGIKPVVGALIDDPADKNMSAVLLAKSNAGYASLCKIITSRKLDENFSLYETIENNSNDLFVLISSLELLKEFKDDNKLKENIFAELISTKQQKRKTRELYNFAKENNFKYVATHPAYFLTKDDHLLHKTVSAIRLNSTLDNLNESESADEEFYLKSPGELNKIWKTLPDAIKNAEYIAENCNVDFEFGKYKFPEYSVPEKKTPFSFLWEICFKGLEKKYNPVTEKAVERLKNELEVIDELGFCDYFLIVWDIVREAKRRNMMNIGRGSAANSLVAYCLEFTQVDPIEQNLYFERFLNRGRTSPPDVDLDFSWKERDEIVKYVYDKYGYDKTAMISTIVTFRARSAFRETAKVFGIPGTEISKFSKFIPWTGAYNLPKLKDKFPEARSLNFDDEPWKSIIEIASKLAGFPRHLSIHPSGIVVTKKPITNYVALEYAKNKGLGLIITQPDMYSIEDMGLIKIDLLSQRALGVLRDTIDKIDQTSVDDTTAPQIFPIDK